MSIEFDRGRLDAALGKECNPPYRRDDKKAAYKRGYRQGRLDVQEENARDKIESMSNDQKAIASNNIQRIKAIIKR